MEHPFVENFEEYKNNKKNFWYYKDKSPVNINYVIYVNTCNWDVKRNDEAYVIKFHFGDNYEYWKFKTQEERDKVYQLFLSIRGFNLEELLDGNE